MELTGDAGARETDLRDRLRANLLPFTDRAFRMLGEADRGRILDVGCGTGIPTVRLVRLGARTVVGLDHHGAAIERMLRRAHAAGLSGRVAGCVASIDHVPFRDASFDTLWCEGALNVLGFRLSLRAWRPLLRPGGALVAHYEAGNVDSIFHDAEAEGFAPLGHFDLPDSAWWDAYYGPVSRLPPEEIDEDLREELQRFRLEPARFRSAFFLLRRIPGVETATSSGQGFG
jgi:SAM-dependent methyltransferase